MNKTPLDPVWTDISATTYNCDSNLSNQSVTLPWDWWNSTWSSISVRIIRTSDSVILWAFPQNLTCSATSWSSTSTPSIDEDCNWVWDNSVSNWSYCSWWYYTFCCCVVNATWQCCWTCQECSWWTTNYYLYY